MTRKILLTLALLLTPTLSRAADLTPRTWSVDNVDRDALVYIPPSAKDHPTPLVFAFHGHGGSSRNAARTFRTHELWPEAIVVYPQGLKTPGRLTDPKGELPGWQPAPGSQSDRDLKFFDAMLASLRKDYNIDPKRIYSTGHSNGGSFTYLLLATRADTFAAIAPSSSAALQILDRLTPKPVLHLGSPKDPLVKFEWQQRTIDALLKLDHCDPTTKTTQGPLTTYPSTTNTPVELYLHDKGHAFPPDAAKVVVDFFKSHPKPDEK